MSEQIKQIIENVKQQAPVPAVSAVFDSGEILELVYRPEDRQTAFVVWKDGKWTCEPSYSAGPGQKLIPYSPNNSLVKNEIVLFPSGPEEYGSAEELVGEIQAFIHRYVDVSPLFLKIATYYVLFSWVYDGFNALPYLRLRGDPGSGKTRFLLVAGSLCYKPIFASGASTVSPLFRILDIFHGTLIIDEGDFRMSDEKAEIVKILNNGNAKGFPVLRSEVSGTREFNPRAYHVFGPKLVAIVTHSTGGLVAHLYILNNPGSHNVRKLITIATPWLGAPLAHFVLETGDWFKTGDWLKDVTIPSTIKKLVEFFPGEHSLLPSPRYFLLGPSPFGETLLGRPNDFSFKQTLDFLNLRFSKSFPGTNGLRSHNRPGQDKWSNDTSGVRYYHLYGEQSKKSLPDTIGKLIARLQVVCGGILACRSYYKFDIEKTSGDGTVPTISASRRNVAGEDLLKLNAPSAKIIPLQSPNESEDADYRHDRLPSNARVIDEVLKALKETSQGLAAFEEGVEPSLEPATETWYFLKLIGVLSVTVSDSFGNKTSLLADVSDNGLPRVTSDILGERAVLITMPVSQTYSVTIKTDDRPIALELTMGVDMTSITQATRYKDLKLPDGVTAILKVTPGGPEMLRYDKEGDGVFETVVAPTVNVAGPGANDVTPPIIAIDTVSQGTRILVTLTAEDNGSGVESISYSLDGTKYQPYSIPLSLEAAQVPVFYCFADDNVGNRSSATAYLVLPNSGIDVPLSTDGGWSKSSLGQGPLLVSYAEMKAATSTQPVVLASYGFTQSNVLVTEVGVPASSPVMNTRMFLDYGPGTDSGVALVNPTNNPITINLALRNQSGSTVSSSTITLAAKAHAARFASQLGLNMPSQFLGTLTLSSGSPFVAVNLRSTANGHGELLFTALPLVDLDKPPAGNKLIFPQIVDGGGIPTQILLMNPSATTSSVGLVSLFDDKGDSLALDFGTRVGVQSTLSHSISPNGMVKFSTTGQGPLRVGYAVVTPTSGPLPIGSGVFSINNSVGLASEAGVPNSPETTLARLFIDVASSSLYRNTGIALVNHNTVPATVNLTLEGFDGFTGEATLTLGPNAHLARFITELFPGQLPADFQGILTIASSSPVAPLTLRLTINERGENIYSTLPVADLKNPPTGSLFLPQIVDGGGYQTQLILINTSDSHGIIHIDFFDDNGVKVGFAFR